MVKSLWALRKMLQHTFRAAMRKLLMNHSAPIMTKEQVIISLQDLPNSFELEDLFERLLLIKRIEEGIRQADNGETVSEAEARAYLGRWSAGLATNRLA